MLSTSASHPGFGTLEQQALRKWNAILVEGTTYGSIGKSLVLDTPSEPLLRRSASIVHLLRSSRNFLGNDVALFAQSLENDGVPRASEENERPSLVVRLLTRGRAVV
jgi:hypothetical protein